MPKRPWLSTTRVILLGFLATIFIGTAFLSLPWATASGERAPFLTALFTATTSVCVTGLVVEVTAVYWSLFGQIIILLLIQVGGLGIIAVTMAAMMMVRRKLGLKSMLLLEDSFNINTMDGLPYFLRRTIFGTFLVEGAGALAYSFVFVPQYGARGIFYGVFHAVSAFCNAGIDLLGANSLADYVDHVGVNLITMTLIILGGIGFIVWWDVLDVCRTKLGRKQSTVCLTSYPHRHLTLHSKVVLCTSFILLAGGMIIFALIEWNNPDTLGPLPAGKKLLAALFQSVTTRTAGFCTVSQSGLRTASVFVSILLMIVGGSPVGTAGGVKTTSVALFWFAALATVKGKEEPVAFRRTISVKNVRKALTVVSVSLLVSFTAVIILLCVCPGSLEDVLYEVFSATATVGLSRDFTASLNSVGRVIIIICMYLGRIGPISLAIALSRRNEEQGMHYATEELTVG